MVICKFFQQGTCRFGTSCKFEHSYGSQYTYRSDQYATNTVNQTNTVKTAQQQMNDPAFLIRSITNDMMLAEKGNQWLITSYGPFRGKPNFPQFEDLSFEEVRWMMYRAQNNGKDAVENVKKIINLAKLTNTEKFKKYQTATKELLDIVKTVYMSNENTNQTSNIFSTTASQPAGSIFGGQVTQHFNSTAPQTSGSIFGGSPPVQNTFGAVNSPLAASQAPVANKSPLANASIFNQQSNNANVFSSNTQPNVFNSANTFNQASSTGSIFTQGTASVFAQQPPGKTAAFPQQNIFNQQQTNVFGNPTNTFNTQQQPANTFAANTTNVFQMQQAQNTANTNVFSQTNVFANQNQPTATSPPTNVFGSTSPQPNVFGTVVAQTNASNTPPSNVFAATTPVVTPPSTNVFGNVIPQSQPPTSTPFGNVLQQSQPTSSPFGAQANTNIFGNNAQNQTNIFNVPGPVQQLNQANVFGVKQQQAPATDLDNIYSKIEDLSKEDIVAFENSVFEFGKIPYNPPPINLC